MSTNTPTDVAAGLAEVRRAFRTLYQYNQLLLDLGKYIGHRLGLTFEGGYPKFSNPSPRRGGGSLSHWAWDWLNMYFYEFYFYRDAGKPTELAFSMMVFSDTGFWDSPSQKQIGERDLSQFASVEQSRTKIVLASGPGKIWNVDVMIGDYAAIQRLLASGKAIAHAVKGGVMISQCFDVADFADSDSTDERLRSFGAACRKKGVRVPELSAVL